MAPANNGMHPTRDTTALIYLKRACGEVMPGVLRLRCMAEMVAVPGEWRWRRMFIALYRWEVKGGREESFQEGWRRLTEEIYTRWGSHGSRLHRAEDGTWVAYAQWPERRVWEASQGSVAVDAEASRLMRESIEVSHPPVLMEVVDDRLSPGGGAAPHEGREQSEC